MDVYLQNVLNLSRINNFSFSKNPFELPAKISRLLKILKRITDKLFQPEVYTVIAHKMLIDVTKIYKSLANYVYTRNANRIYPH